MRNTIYLVRHAEAESNISPFHVGEAHLTVQGIIQSEKLAKQLSNKGIENIYTSNILRAKLTAEEISKVINKTVTELSLLKERKGNHSSDNVFVPDELFDDIKKRVTEIRLFLENHSEGKIIIVSHAIFIKNLLADIMTGGFENESVISKIEDALVIDNATISKIVFNKEKKKWRIIYLNCLT